MAETEDHSFGSLKSHYKGWNHRLDAVGENLRQPADSGRVAPQEVIFPGQRRGDNGVKVIVFGFPAQNGLYPVSTGNDGDGVAGPPGYSIGLDGTAMGFFHGLDDLQNRVAPAITAIEDTAFTSPSQMGQVHPCGPRSNHSHEYSRAGRYHRACCSRCRKHPWIRVGQGRFDRPP